MQLVHRLKGKKKTDNALLIAFILRTRVFLEMSGAGTTRQRLMGRIPLLYQEITSI